MKVGKKSQLRCRNCGTKYTPAVDWQKCCTVRCADALRHRRAYQVNKSRRNGNGI